MFDRQSGMLVRSTRPVHGLLHWPAGDARTSQQMLSYISHNSICRAALGSNDLEYTQGPDILGFSACCIHNQIQTRPA